MLAFYAPVANADRAWCFVAPDEHRLNSGKHRTHIEFLRCRVERNNAPLTRYYRWPTLREMVQYYANQ